MEEIEKFNEVAVTGIYTVAGFLADFVDKACDRAEKLLESLEDEAPRKGF